MKKRKSLAYMLLTVWTMALCGCTPATSPSSPSSTDPVSPDNPSARNEKPFEMVGIYAWTYNSEQGKFWKACGVNTIQLIDASWHKNENTILDEYIAGVAQQIRQAQEDGFRVNILLMSNLEQWRGPEDTGPGMGALFDPGDAEKIADRLACLRRNIRAWSQADSFTMIAGDPGGIADPSWTSGSAAFVELGKAAREVVREEAPQASFHLNTWAIAYYDAQAYDFANMHDKPEYWIQMDTMSQEVAQAIKDTDIGLEFAGQDWYQRVTKNVYASAYDDVSDFPLYPSATDLAVLGDPENREIWAWPYFFLDLITFDVQVHVRYIYQYVQDMRALPIDGIMGDYSEAGYQSHALNTYAFGRFCNDATATPEQVIREYALLNATEETAPLLEQVLRYLENHGLYEQTMPKMSKLPPIEADIRYKAEALAALKRVEWRKAENVSFDLPQAPEDFGQMLIDFLSQS